MEYCSCCEHVWAAVHLRIVHRQFDLSWPCMDIFVHIWTLMYTYMSYIWIDVQVCTCVNIYVCVHRWWFKYQGQVVNVTPVRVCIEAKNHHSASNFICALSHRLGVATGTDCKCWRLILAWSVALCKASPAGLYFYISKSDRVRPWMCQKSKGLWSLQWIVAGWCDHSVSLEMCCWESVSGRLHWHKLETRLSQLLTTDSYDCVCEMCYLLLLLHTNAGVLSDKSVHNWGSGLMILLGIVKLFFIEQGAQKIEFYAAELTLVFGE